MPTAPLSYCGASGCNNRVQGGYCPTHRTAQRLTERRFQVGGLNYGRPWRRRRRDPHLARNPLCVACQAQGLNVLAEEVDHIVPHRGDRDVFWNTHNLESLCKSCHSRKTAGEVWAGRR